MSTSKPSTSQWPHLAIRASAGTGKTFRLSNRYLDLLAHGIASDEILATTFTRKAAGEILDRILLRLAQAATDEKKRSELARFLPGPDLSEAACLRLLAQTTRHLHRLRVSTLDSFFMAIAGSYSLELGLPSGWTIVDDVTDGALRAEAIRAALSQDDTSSLVALLHLLTKGETTRSVFREVQEVVANLYGIYLETSPEVWQALQRSKGLEDRQREELLQAIENLPLTENRLIKRRQEDVELARTGAWQELVSKGFAKKLLQGETKFYNKELPADLVALYQQLLDHAQAELINPIVFQNEATLALLQKFDREYQRLKLTHKAFRFEDVTRLVARSPGLGQVESLGFRLDGGVRHLLLDEFQDTSLSQWQVLRPFAQHVTSATQATSFFCVGDVKQAIYGWRGGLAQIFDALTEELTGLTQEQLVQSFRSSRPVIDTANLVFSKLQQHNNLDAYASVVAQWQERFSTHDTALDKLPGYACLRTLPEVPDEEDDEELRNQFVAKYVQQLLHEAPGCEVGILVKTNETVRQLIFALRDLGIHASEEGGNPLTDSAAVQLILSLLQLADHPGDTAAWFHVATSPLGPAMEMKRAYFSQPAAELAARLRQNLLARGYGPCVLEWAKLLAPACNRREMSRLDQLVELAYRYRPDGSLRAADFISLVEEQKISDPTSAPVRVMNIHQSKGLEFDIVVLPELDKNLVGQPPRFVVGRPSPIAPIEAVCRYIGQDLQPFLPQKFQQMFEQATADRVSEALCVLYVAITRAKHALHMLIAEKPAKSDKSAKSFAGLLRAALCDNRPLAGDAIAFETGDAQWYRQITHAPAPVAATVSSTPMTITLAPTGEQRHRGWQAVSPSQLEGGQHRRITDIFRHDRAAGQLFGTLAHAWLAKITWLEAGLPTDDTLRRTAIDEVGWQQSLDGELRQFKRWMSLPGVHEMLREQHYRELQKTKLPLSVHNEFPFAFREAGQLVNGSIDRLVLQHDGQGVVAAEVIDYKTDTLPPGESAELAAKVEYYRPQLAAYRRAVARLYRLPLERVAAKLIFLAHGQVVTV